MRGGFLVGLPAGQEGNAGDRRGNAILQQPNGFLRDLFSGGLLRTLLARNDHVGFQDHAFQRDALDPQFLKRLVENALAHFMAAIDVMIAIHQDFGLNDRDKLCGLA